MGRDDTNGICDSHFTGNKPKMTSSSRLRDIEGENRRVVRKVRLKEKALIFEVQS